MLDLAYLPDLPSAQRRALEREGRRRGLALGELEELGRRQHLRRAFLAAARRRDEGRLRFLARIAQDLAGIPLPRAVAPDVSP